jgi:NAD(P)-dependent dehydrogenase (short-subunit alcohol dehydrogenase family)
MKWTDRDVSRQDGRVAVITGANTGLGLETARVLADRGATVVLACRDVAKGEAAVSRRGGDTSCVALDLASLESVREAAAQLRRDHPRIDLLINNAGVMMTPESLTSDGFELQYGTNHLGHFALTGLLLPSMLTAPGSRVVTVSSFAHTWGSYPPRRNYNAVFAYGDSKLANLLFAFELQRRLEAADARTISLAAHPGYARTTLTRYLPALLRAGDALLAQNAQMGALPQLRAATDPAARGGEFYGPRWIARGYPSLSFSMPRARDRDAASRLWADSEEKTGVGYNLNPA